MTPDYFSLRRTMIRLCGGKCCDGRYCGGGTTIDALLTIDHIYGDGIEARKKWFKNKKRRGRSADIPPSARMKEWQHAIDGGYVTERYQVLCWNCHQIKTQQNKDDKPKSFDAVHDHLPLFDGLDPPVQKPRWTPKKKEVDWEAQMRIAAAVNDVFDRGNLEEV